MFAGALLLATLPTAFAAGAPFGLAVTLWLAFGAVAAGDLLMSSRRPPDLTIDHPPEIFVGETVALTLSASPAPPGLSARLAWPEGIEGPAQVELTGDAVPLPVRAVRRGAWSIDAIWLRWPTRLGLFEFVPRRRTDIRLRVVPNIRLIESGEITSTVQSTLYGIKENRALGEGSEFHQLQDFVRGMDVKTIDWKRSARRRSLVAREMRAERNHHVIVALDNGYLMRERIAGLPRIDHAVTAALATAWAAAIGGDLVGLFTFDTRPRLWVAPRGGRQAFARLRSHTADLDYVSRETNHTLALSELNARTPKRSLLIIFTDFVDTTSAELMVENIAILARRHLVLFVTLRDPEMEAIAGTAPDDLDGAARIVAAAQSLDERRLVLERLTRLGVTVVDAEPGQVTARLLARYLDITARGLI